MIPRGSQALGDIAMKLAFAIAPEASSAFAAANTGYVALLLQCIAQDYDRAADVRLTDIREMKALLAELAAHAPRDVASGIHAFQGEEPASMRIHDLDALHAKGLDLVIRVHAHVERTGDGAADRRIWAFLTRFADRHAFQLPAI